MSKPLPPLTAWIPTVHFAEPDLEVILSPFCVSSDEAFSSGLVPKALRELHDDSKSGGQHSFPACLSQPVTTFKSAFLTAELGGLMVAYNFQSQDSTGKGLSDQDVLEQARLLSRKEDIAAPGKPAGQEDASEEVKEEAKEELKEDTHQALTEGARRDGEPASEKAETLPDLPKFEIQVVPSAPGAALPGDGASDEKAKNADKAEGSGVQFALLKFESEQAALRYLVRAKQSQCVLSFLSSHQLSKLLQLHH